MTTIRQLIDQLNNHDLDQTIVYQYFTIDHFEHTGVVSETWEKVAQQNDDILTNSDAYSVIEHAIQTNNK